MRTAFEAYVRRYKNGHVPTNWVTNPKLGRWVAMLRYHRKLGQLTFDTIAELDKLGFIWAPTDLAWDANFEKMRLFCLRFKHCKVPAAWPEDVNLANWAANQRRRHKRGVLNPERTRRLAKLGFVWMIYGRKHDAAVAHDKQRGDLETIAPRSPASRKSAMDGERVYNIGASGYVQYGGHGPIPTALRLYRERNNNEWPPYIQLPSNHTRYVLSNEGNPRASKIDWKGRGPLPAEILEFLNENGTLPPLF